jgi:hypothetical protein
MAALAVVPRRYVQRDERARVDRFNAALARLEAEAALAAAEMERLAARKKRAELKRKRLEGFLIAVIEHAGASRLEGYTSTFRVRANPPSVCIEDGVELPAEFLRYPAAPPPAPDKGAIKIALTTGRDVPGASLVQTLRLVRS